MICQKSATPEIVIGNLEVEDSTGIIEQLSLNTTQQCLILCCYDQPESYNTILDTSVISKVVPDFRSIQYVVLYHCTYLDYSWLRDQY